MNSFKKSKAVHFHYAVNLKVAHVIVYLIFNGLYFYCFYWIL